MKIIQFDGAYEANSEIHEQIIIELWFFLRLKIGESFISFKVNCLPVKSFFSPFSLFHFPSHHLPAWPLSRAKSSGIIDWHPGTTNSLLTPSNPPWPSLSPILFRGTSPLPPPTPWSRKLKEQNSVRRGKCQTANFDVFIGISPSSK